MHHDHGIARPFVDVVKPQTVAGRRPCPGWFVKNDCRTWLIVVIAPGTSDSPFQAEHHAVQSAADPQEGDAVAGFEEIAVGGQCGRHRQRDGPHVAQVGKRGKIPRFVDTERPEDRLAV